MQTACEYKESADVISLQPQQNLQMSSLMGSLNIISSFIIILYLTTIILVSHYATECNISNRKLN